MSRWKDLSNWVPIRSLARRHRWKLVQHLVALSGPDRYLRFGHHAGDAQIERYGLTLDFDRDAVLGVFNRRLELVATAHVAFDTQVEGLLLADTAEFGVSVLERYRGRGLGGRLFQRACLHARNRQMQYLLIHALAENAPMLRMAVRHGAWQEESEYGSITSRLHLPTDNWLSHAEQALESRLGELDFKLKHQAKQFQQFVDNAQTEVKEWLADDEAPSDPPAPP
jgi:GNAT superfamily N-acetyltransferase